MGYQKAAHHRGQHQTIAKRVTDPAKANPATRCWRCNRTIAQVRERKPNAIWTAGHLVDGQVGGPYAPECSPCNYSHGAIVGNRKRGRRRPQPPYFRTSQPW